MQDILVVCDENACIDFAKVGKRIKEICKEKHMAQPVFYLYVDVQIAIETGVNKPSIEIYGD